MDTPLNPVPRRISTGRLWKSSVGAQLREFQPPNYIEFEVAEARASSPPPGHRRRPNPISLRVYGLARKMPLA